MIEILESFLNSTDYCNSISQLEYDAIVKLISDYKRISTENIELKAKNEHLERDLAAAWKSYKDLQKIR